MAKSIVVIAGHPDSQSFNTAMAQAYADGARQSGAEVRYIALGQLRFEPNLLYGFRQRTELEADLLEAQQAIREADHLVFVYPTWWGTMPALLKGFIDRLFLPGFAFKYRDHSSLWDKLLAGKTARLIVTSDTPVWYNWLVYGNAGHRVMKRNVLHFCGVRPVRLSEFGPVKASTGKARTAWLAKAKRLGLQRV